MQNVEVKKGICRVCGCTMDNPCYNPKAGFCWWTDESETLCSHCYGIFKNDPATVHRVKNIQNWNPDGE